MLINQMGKNDDELVKNFIIEIAKIGNKFQKKFTKSILTIFTEYRIVQREKEKIEKARNKR